MELLFKKLFSKFLFSAENLGIRLSRGRSISSLSFFSKMSFLLLLLLLSLTTLTSVSGQPMPNYRPGFPPPSFPPPNFPPLPVPATFFPPGMTFASRTTTPAARETTTPKPVPHDEWVTPSDARGGSENNNNNDEKENKEDGRDLKKEDDAGNSGAKNRMDAEAPRSTYPSLFTPGFDPKLLPDDYPFFLPSPNHPVNQSQPSAGDADSPSTSSTATTRPKWKKKFRPRRRNITCECEGEDILQRLQLYQSTASVFNLHRNVLPRMRLFSCAKGEKLFVSCAGKCFKVKFREKRWRTDMKCDANDEEGKFECDPAGLFPCCSAHGWCGNSPGHCDCPGCKDYRKLGSEIRGCVQGPPVRKRATGCSTDDNWTDICFCDTDRCNGGVSRRRGVWAATALALVGALLKTFLLTNTV